MDPEKFISIDDESISLRQALGYLRFTGELQPFLMRILRQHIIEKELEQRGEMEVDSTRLEQTIINFRLQNELVQPDRFDKWLSSQGLNYTTFRYQFAMGLKVEQLKNEVTSERVEQYFNENKPLFEQAVLSRIVLADRAKAEELKRELTENGADFATVAREHSQTNDRLYNGMMGSVAISQLPPQVRDALASAQPGDIVGPVEFEGRHSILRLEERIAPTLEGQLKRQLQEQFFEQWWQSKLQNKNVKLEIE